MGRIRFAFPPLSAVVCAAFLVGTGAVTRSETPAVAAGQSDPASVALLSPAIARHFPDPAGRYETPAFTPGREGFPAHDEVLTFARGLALRHPSHVTFEVIGASQEGREVPLLILAAGGRPLASRPTVLVIGQQHGNEPAGGEGALAIATELAGPRAALLNHVNVFIVPRANPDGAARFVRATPSGTDVNRDHLLLQTPEARALAGLVRRQRPQIVLDLHEFTVGDRWVRKFGVVQAYDALLQPATVGNLHPAVSRAAEGQFLARMRAALEREGQRTFVYHTTSPDVDDKAVSMGGVQPDTGRNVNGLRQAVSILVETRGIGLGRAHLARRVHAHVTAALAAVEEAARQGPRLVARVHAVHRDVAAEACRGALVVDARLRPGRQVMTFLDATTGEERRLDVEWRSAVKPLVTRSRQRPCGYLLAATERAAVERLKALGVAVQRVVEPGTWRLERYHVDASDEGQRQDARGAIDDGAPIRLFTVRLVRGRAPVAAGDFYISMAQPLGAIVAAALEPDSQSSFAANGLLDIEHGGLRRVMTPPPARALVRDDSSDTARAPPIQ